MTSAMEWQDEIDKANVALMGLSDKTKDETVSSSRAVKGQTKIPPSTHENEHMIGLEKNCMSCAYTQNNEATLKAFKMACLAYQPSAVTYEQTEYSRQDLIKAKQILMRYCLDELRHLDLGTIDSVVANRLSEQPVDPKHVPPLPPTDNLQQSSIYSVVQSKQETTVVPRLDLYSARRKNSLLAEEPAQLK
jgi:transposase-like protein